MNILGAVGATIANFLFEPIVGPIVAPIRQWLCYSFDYDSNIKTLKHDLKMLQITRKGVQDSVDFARGNGEEIDAHDTTWLKNVDDITEEAKTVLQDEERAQTRCASGVCPNLVLRHQLSQKAKEIVEVIIELREKGKWTRKDMSYMNFVSRMSTAKGLMEALGDVDTKVIIGLWGMAGVGKTTLVQEVSRKAMQKKLFDEVAKADVTHTPDLIRIQGQIADSLNLKLDAEGISVRADLLMKRLTKHKKILVILDNIWDKLDLEKIGIPSTGCKLLLTSRDKDLLSSKMGTKKNFGLEVLPEKEAWNLFEKMAGDCVQDPHLQSTAIAIAKECAGLPLALVTVSKALKDKELFKWNNAQQLLRSPTHENVTTMQAIIYSSIELSYSHLESREVQDVFLLSAQMDYSIFNRDLLKYCYGLGSFLDIDNLEQARNRLYSLVDNLTDMSLLLDCPYGSEHWHMHDVVRDAAIVIASRDRNMFVVRDNSGLKKLPDVDSLKRCRALSIPGGDNELPNEMECPELRLFYVYGGDHPLQIPKTFFKAMGKLQVLDLTEMKLPSLPSSLGLLTNLQALCLDRCVLGDISAIGELKNLVALSLIHSKVSQLPREIGFLTHLRLLDLSNCKLEVIPPNVLSSLVELEELFIGNSFVQWEAEGLTNERKNASLVELKVLSKLITLEIHIRDVSNLPKGLSFEKLQRYVIFVGDLVWDSSSVKRKVSRTLKLKVNTSLNAEVEVGIKMIPKRTEDLYLDELKGVKSLLIESNRQGFQDLKHLDIQNNPEIEYIVAKLRRPVVAFPALQSLVLKNMNSLKEICHGQLPSRSFSNLKILKVGQCNNLKFVFSSSMARSLSQLQELEVRECSFMGAIVMKEEGKIEDIGTFLFPKLILLALERLPNLMSFLSTQNPSANDVGEITSEQKLDFQIPILHKQVVFPNRLELSLVNLGATGTEFPSLKNLWIEDCPKLKTFK